MTHPVAGVSCKVRAAMVAGAVLLIWNFGLLLDMTSVQPPGHMGSEDYLADPVDSREEPREGEVTEVASDSEEIVTNGWLKDTTLGWKSIPGYDPVAQTLTKHECGVMCESIEACAAAKWTCGGACDLKRKSPFLMPAKASCSYIYKRGSSQQYQDMANSRTNISASLHPLVPSKSTVVVIIRCHQIMGWLPDLLYRAKELSASEIVQVVIYERCEIPSSLSTTWEGTSIQRQVLPAAWEKGLIAIAHLMVNKAFYEQGFFSRTVVVDADHEMPQLRYDKGFTLSEETTTSKAIEGQAPRGETSGRDRVEPMPFHWRRMSMNEFVDVLTTIAVPLAIAQGLQLIESGSFSQDFIPRLKKMGMTLALSKEVTHFMPQGGWLFCPASTTYKAEPITESSKLAVLTYLSDMSYISSARVLLHSLNVTGSRTPTIVGVMEGMYDQVQPRIARDFPDTLVVEWPRVQHARNDEVAQKRWRNNYQKLSIFDMADYDAILYIDADMVALQSPDSIFQLPAVRHMVGPFLGSPNWGHLTSPPNAGLNSGVFLARPDRSVFQCIVKSLQILPSNEVNPVDAEQGFLRWFFGDEWTQIPYLYNVQQTLKRTLPELWDDEKTILLHFVGTKPHLMWSMPQWLRHFSKERNHPKGDADDEKDDFSKVAFYWKKLYFELAQFQTKVTIFASYHNEDNYEEHERWADERPEPSLYMPLALAKPIHKDGLTVAEYYTEARNATFQTQLGELAGLLAMSKAPWYTKDWIGFTTASEHRKGCTFREGVSLDWTKVEQVFEIGPEQQHIIFWYGIFAGDYWELVEHHHVGMSKVMLEVLEKVGVKTSSLAFPKNSFWPFGNYMILPTAVLRDYAKFTLKFIKAYQDLYGGGCPFTTSETHTPDWELRCLGYLGERLIHFYIVMNDLPTEYAVDDVKFRYTLGCKAHKVHCRKPGDSSLSPAPSLRGKHKL